VHTVMIRGRRNPSRAHVTRGCPAHDRGIMSCPDTRGGSQPSRSSAKTVRRQGGKEPSGDEAQRRSDRETGSRADAIPPRMAPLYRIRVNFRPVGRRIQMLPGPGKHKMTKLIYTMLVKYNRVHRPCAVRRPSMRPALRQTKTRLLESSNVAKPHGWREPLRAGAPFAGAFLRSIKGGMSPTQPHKGKAA
jgi:hypothetical protein